MKSGCQPILFDSVDKLWIWNDSRYGFGFGTKARKFEGLSALAKKNKIHTLRIIGNLHSNAMAAYSFLARSDGFQVESICYNRDVKLISPNSIVVQNCSHSLVSYPNRQDFLSALREMEELPFIWTIPEFGFHPAALMGLKPIWSQIESEKPDCLILDAGSGLTLLSAIEYFGSEIPIIAVSIGRKTDRMRSELMGRLMELRMEYLMGDLQKVHFLDVAVGSFGSSSRKLEDWISYQYSTNELALEPIYSAKSLYTIQENAHLIQIYKKPLYLHQGGLLNHLHLLRKSSSQR